MGEVFWVFKSWWKKVRYSFDAINKENVPALGDEPVRLMLSWAGLCGKCRRVSLKILLWII